MFNYTYRLKNGFYSISFNSHEMIRISTSIEEDFSTNNTSAVVEAIHKKYNIVLICRRLIWLPLDIMFLKMLKVNAVSLWSSMVMKKDSQVVHKMYLFFSLACLLKINLRKKVVITEYCKFLWLYYENNIGPKNTFSVKYMILRDKYGWIKKKEKRKRNKEATTR